VPGYRQAEALLAVGAPRQQTEAILYLAHQTAVTLGAAPLRREVELLAQRGRLRSGAGGYDCLARGAGFFGCLAWPDPARG
jgi:hypothetical protein